MRPGSLWRDLSFERKLLVTFLLLALVPTLLLIATQKNRIERTIDFWENPGVERSLNEALALARAALSAERERARELVGELLAPFPDAEGPLDAAAVRKRLEPRMGAGGLDLLDLYVAREPSGRDGRRIVSLRAPAVPPAAALPGPFEDATGGGLVVAHGSVRLRDGTYLVATGARLLPAEMRERVDVIREGAHFYSRLRVYEGYAKAKVTLQAGAILIAAALVAFLVARFLARSLARPIGALVEGTKRIREGDLGVRIEGGGSKEIGMLIESFNEMAGDLERSREKLIRAERVATWGEAARRIAHEIANPLTPITLSLHRLRKRSERLPDEERRAFGELIEPILEEVGNLVSLANGFSQFSRMPEPAKEPVDVADLLEKLTALYMEGTGVRLRVEVAPGTPPAIGDRELLWRAFSNLVKNGVEAMNGAGDLSLRARRREDRVEVSVSDHGPGIDGEVRKRIFAPYFTTKKRGSGLGLALVERIILDHGGSIAVLPNEPKGTTFRVTLPAAKA